jgi:hypothetical protein
LGVYCGIAGAVFSEGVKTLNKILRVGSLLKLKPILKQSALLFLKKYTLYKNTIHLSKI